MYLKNSVNLIHLNLRRCQLKSHYFTSLLFYSTFISITKPHLLVVPLSTPQSHYLTVFLQELSSKCLSTGLRIDPFLPE